MQNEIKKRIKKYLDIMVRNDWRSGFEGKDIDAIFCKKLSEEECLFVSNVTLQYLVSMDNSDQLFEVLKKAEEKQSRKDFIVIVYNVAKIWRAQCLREAKIYALCLQDVILSEMMEQKSRRVFEENGGGIEIRILYQLAMELCSIIVPEEFSKRTRTFLHLFKKDLIPLATKRIADGLRDVELYKAAELLYEVAVESKTGLGQLSKEEYLDAYNLWGLCAEDQREHWKAYEVYKQWIDKNDLKRADDIWCYLSAESVDEEKKLYQCAARIYGNLAYICGEISDEYGSDEIEKKVYRKRAIDYINTAIMLDEDWPTYLCTRATLYYDNGEYDRAIDEYEAYYSHPKADFEDRITGLRCCIEAQLEQFCCCVDELDGNLKTDLQAQKVLFKRLEEYLTIYKDSLTGQPFRKEEIRREVEYAKELLSNFDLNAELDNIDEIRMELLCIYIIAQVIRKRLRYDIIFPCNTSAQMASRNQDALVQKRSRKYPHIVYYTTLKNVQYLLKKVYRPKGEPFPVPTEGDYQKENEDWGIRAGEEAKNCLTMMHAYYMNDPNEGLTLLQALSDAVDESEKINYLFRRTTPAIFREQLFDQKFVFIKSFTSLVDQLNMWTMYASDRSEGSDSNGCCVCVAPETFEMMVNSGDSSMTGTLMRKKDDDYHLYRVVYVKDGEIQNGDKELCRYYDKLKRMIVVLNDELIRCGKKEAVESLCAGLHQTLADIAFLFKDASYSEEKELRLVINRNRTDIQEIQKTSEKPPKLFIMPYHQIYVEKIILGPKLLNQDKWIPYLQYNLIEMWDLWPESKYGARVPVVRKSAISYRD